MRYLIVLIPDLCTFTYFDCILNNLAIRLHFFSSISFSTCRSVLLNRSALKGKHPAVLNVICIIYLQNLEDNIELTKIKIERAEKLISGLGGEKDRWTQVGIYSLKFDHHQAKRTFFLEF